MVYAEHGLVIALHTLPQTDKTALLTFLKPENFVVSIVLLIFALTKIRVL